MVEDMLQRQSRAPLGGRKIVEIRPGWLHRGAVAKRIISRCGPAEFELALRDDRTDEDLFEATIGGFRDRTSVGAGG